MKAIKNLYWKGVCKGLEAKENIKKKMVTGDGHLIAIALVVVFILIMAALFRDALTEIINGFLTDAKTKANALFT